MQTVAVFDLKTLARAAGYLLLGGLCSIAIALPLFSVLNYWAGLVSPLLLAWFVASVAFAFTCSAPMARAYVFGNSGVLAATAIVFVAGWIMLVASHARPDPALAAPLYLIVILAGLVGGASLGYGGEARGLANVEPSVHD
jgi:uncharacterized membrane protein